MRKMKTKIWIFAIALLATVAVADVPRPQPVSRYTELWTKSRITSKPDPVTVEETNILDDYVLLSVTPLGDDYMVSIKNTKNATEGRIRIYPGESNEAGFSVKSVEQSSDYLATKVTLVHDGKVGVVEYDEKFLALKKPPAAAPRQAPAKNQKGNNRTAKPSTANTNANKPPNPAANKANSNQNLPPGIQSALQGNTQATTGQSTNSTKRKPRVRRVPTPPSR